MAPPEIPRVFTLTMPGPSARRRFLFNAAMLLAGAGLGLALAAWRRRRSRPSTSSQAALVGVQLETRRAIDRLLQLHFGHPETALLPALLPTHPTAVKLPDMQLNLAASVALLCERHCTALTDFTGEFGVPTALDLGCGVGAVAFELTRAGFHVVHGVDTSSSCINAARILKERGWMRYTRVEEGDLTSEHTAAVAEDAERALVSFATVPELTALPRALSGPYDAVVACQVLCRLPDPRALLHKLPSLLRPGGVVVLASSYDWPSGATPHANWLGGFAGREGAEVWSEEELAKELGVDFELVQQEELPFVVREGKRKFEVGVAHATAWQRK